MSDVVQGVANDVNRIGIDAATEVLRDAYGDRDPRAVAEDCFDAYVKAISPHSVAKDQAEAEWRADVTEALDTIDKHAERDLDHELHAIVEHYRSALLAPPEPPVGASSEHTPSGTTGAAPERPLRGQNV